LIPSSMLYLLH